jgi:predicted nucleic acid-binding protein
MSGYLLDSSFVIPFLREQSAGVAGEASRYLSGLSVRARVHLSIIAYAEILEHAADPVELARELRTRFRFLGLGQDIAERVALIQTRSARRMGENDAWIAATAMKGGFVLVGHDDEAFKDRPGLTYVNFRR